MKAENSKKNQDTEESYTSVFILKLCLITFWNLHKMAHNISAHAFILHLQTPDMKSMFFATPLQTP